MKKSSKRYEKLNLIPNSGKHDYRDSILLAKSFASARFLESLEVHASLNIDVKFPNQQERSSIILPYGLNKRKVIAVFTENESLSSELVDLGVSFVGSLNILDLLSKGSLPFEILIADSDSMSLLTKYGKLLGPKGLMPSLKSGTITSNVMETAKDFLGGKLEYKADKRGVVHLPFGKANMASNELEYNLVSVYDSILKNKPSGVKGKYFKSLFICATVSPSIEVDINSFYSKR